MKKEIVTLGCTLGLALGVTAAPQDRGITGSGPSGLQYDEWENLTVTNPQIAGTTIPFPFPSFPGASPWPVPIESDAVGSGDGQFNKTSGFGYPAGISIYASPFGNGSFEITDNTVVSGLELVFVQVEIGEGSSGDIAGIPTLEVTGTSGTTVLNPTQVGVVTKSNEPNPFFGGAILPVTTYGYEFDTRGLGATSFDFDFSTAGTSTTISGLRVDQSDVFQTVNIPEPAALVLIGLAAPALMRRRSRDERDAG